MPMSDIAICGVQSHVTTMPNVRLSMASSFMCQLHIHKMTRSAWTMLLSHSSRYIGKQLDVTLMSMESSQAAGARWASASEPRALIDPGCIAALMSGSLIGNVLVTKTRHMQG